MGYSIFKTYEEVAIKFKIKLLECHFVEEKEIVVKPAIFEFIADNLATRRNYVSEHSICETLISPILNVISKPNNLPVWSHVRFDVSESEGLVGIPDFIVSPASEIGTIFDKPIICVAEAKKENFNEGWAQALAEMIAAQKFNQDEVTDIFGIVTTGNIWQFGKLQEKFLTMEIVSYSALENLQGLMNRVNWIFSEAGKKIFSSASHAP